MVGLGFGLRKKNFRSLDPIALRPRRRRRRVGRRQITSISCQDYRDAKLGEFIRGIPFGCLILLPKRQPSSEGKNTAHRLETPVLRRDTRGMVFFYVTPSLGFSRVCTGPFPASIPGQKTPDSHERVESLVEQEGLRDFVSWVHANSYTKTIVELVVRRRHRLASGVSSCLTSSISSHILRERLLRYL